MGAHAYVTSNALSGLAATAFTWSNAATTNRSYLNDGRIGRRMVVGASVASGINVVINLGSQMRLVGLAVLNSNAAVQKADAALRVRAADDAAITVNVVTLKPASTLYSSLAPRNKDHVLQFTAPSAPGKQYYELTWTWTGNVTNFAIGELFGFTASTQLSRRTVYGSGEGKKFWSASEQFQTGERRGLALGGPQRMLDLQFSDLSSSERDELDAMWVAAQGDVSPFLWIDSYESTALAAASAEQNCVFGRLEEKELAFPQDDYGIYNPSTRGFRLRSAGREAGA